MLLTQGGYEWLTQRQKVQYPVTNFIIQPDLCLFLFFFFFVFFFPFKGICCTSCQNISIVSCQQIHLSLMLYARKPGFSSSIKQLKPCKPNSKQTLLWENNKYWWLEANLAFMTFDDNWYHQNNCIIKKKQWNCMSSDIIKCQEKCICPLVSDPNSVLNLKWNLGLF